MYLSNAYGVTRMLRRKPQLVRLAGRKLAGQLHHRLNAGRSEGFSMPPEQIGVVVTDVCNLRCKMCQYAFSDSPGYQLNQIGRMKPALFRKLMDEVPGKPLVTFTGGETLLNPHIAELVAYAKTKDRPTTLVTNGWMLAKRAQSLSDAGLDSLVVSVDGPRTVHNHIRGENSFEKLSEGLETILELPNRPIVFISMAISDLNFTELETMYEMALQWNVDGLNFNHLWMQTHGMVESFNTGFGSLFQADEVAWPIKHECVDADQVADSIQRIRRRNRGNAMIFSEAPYISRDEIKVWYHDPEEFVKWTTTRCAWIQMKVWPNGAVKPCRDWVAGNVAVDHAMDIWNGERFKQFRRILSTEGTLPICARCCYLVNR